MNTKKFKFQERLETIAKEKFKDYNPEEDRGSMNDKLKLHKMDDPGRDGQTSQTAQDPLDTKVISINELNDIIKGVELRLIPEKDMPQDPDARDGHYGFNTGIQKCLDYLKRVSKLYQFNLHKEDLK